MRARTFILFLLFLVVLAVVVVLGFTVGNWGELLGLGGNNNGVVDQQEQDPDDGVGQVVPPTPTAMPTTEVVVAAVDLPVGVMITEDVLEIRRWPDDNVAVVGNYVFNSVEDVVGTITRTEIEAGQAILDSMVALTPSDLLSMGSDLALYVNTGNVAVAFPIDRFSGAAYAMRPGDRVDVLMSLQFVNIDQEFASALPNLVARVNDAALEEGTAFLLPAYAEGRLELVPGINLVGMIGPRGQEEWLGASPDDRPLLQIPRRSTQLTIQQANVVWVGTWQDPREVEAANIAAQEAAAAQQQAGASVSVPTPQPVLERSERQPDIVILSMSAQDALVLKWALDRGLDVDLALRAQNDTSVFTTVSVTLPQLVEQSGFTIPERTEEDLSPRADEVEPPSVPVLPPE